MNFRKLRKGKFLKSSPYEHKRGPGALMEMFAISEQIKADAVACTDCSTQRVLSTTLKKATPECSSKVPVVYHLMGAGFLLAPSKAFW